jgi:hypothetical protein
LLRERCVGTDAEQTEVVVVVGAGGLEEHGARELADHLEAEGLLVEDGGALSVAHVQDGVVQSTHRDHGAFNPRPAPRGPPLRGQLRRARNGH